MMRFLRAMLLSIVVMLVVVSCGDRGSPEPAHVITPAVRATCLLLRAFDVDGHVDEVCATAEDLAPLLGEILAQHEANERAREAVMPTPVRPEPLIAFSIAPPKRPQPKRRCAQWVYLSSDAGVEASAGEGGSDGGR